MLFPGQSGKSLVSEEFNRLCTDMLVEARVTALPNPGDFFKSMRVIHFHSFNNCTVIITQSNKKKTQTRIPAKGECDIMLTSNEDMPTIEKETNG